MAQQRIEIGGFTHMHRETYGECARVTLQHPADDGRYSACVVDGILYLSARQKDGKYAIICANSTFDLEVIL